MFRSVVQSERIAALTLVTGLIAFMISGIVASTVRRMGTAPNQIASSHAFGDSSLREQGWQETHAYVVAAMRNPVVE